MAEPLNGTELAVAHAVWFAIGGPDGQDWLDAQRLARGALEAIEDQGYVVMSRSALDELERQTDPDYEPPYPPVRGSERGDCSVCGERLYRVTSSRGTDSGWRHPSGSRACDPKQRRAAQQVVDTSEVTDG